MESSPKFSNISANTGKFIYSLAESLGAKNILEIGTSNGYSTQWLAQTKVKVTTIEIREDRFSEAKKNLKEFKNVTLLFGDALKIISTLKGKFDFVFLDATKRQNLQYLKLLLPKLEENCVIVADNVIDQKEKVKEYVDFVKKNYKSNTLNIGKGLEITTIVPKDLKTDKEVG